MFDRNNSPQQKVTYVKGESSTFPHGWSEES